MKSLLLLSVVLAAASAQELNIVDTARRLGIYSYILALEESNSLDLVQYTKNITVFMPTNEAFLAVTLATRAQWRSDPAYYQKIIRYHVLEGARNSTEFHDEASYPTYAGWTGRFINYDGFSKNVQLYQGAVISRFNIMASNGIIHLVDQVVTQVQNQTLAQIVQQRTDLTKINAAVKLVVNISNALDGMAPVTFLAPSDDAISKLPQGQWDKVLANNTLLTEILRYHVLPQGTWFSRGLVDGLSLPTYNSKGNVTVTFPGNALFFDKSKAAEADLAATNGVAYVLDTILTPPDLVDFF